MATKRIKQPRRSLKEAFLVICEPSPNRVSFGIIETKQ